MSGVILQKVEMTRVIKNNAFVPVTLLSVPTLVVVGKRTMEKDGYEAIMVGVPAKDVPELKEGKATLAKNAFTQIVEFKTSKLDEFEVGKEISMDVFDGVELVDLTGTSKGKGFAGAMKRHNFSGGPKTHGSKFHRALGSIGNRKPTRTHKGKKMHGHMGVDTVTLKKVPLELVNKEARIIGVKGSVPGARKSYVTLRFSY